ncbi:MAG: hypothetical protein ACLFPN_06360 [Methanomassiliicoccales archaeon]
MTPLSRDRGGIGGFLESIISVILVTSAITLVAFSLTLFATGCYGSTDGNEDLVQWIEGKSGLIDEDGSLHRPVGDELEPGELSDFRIELMEVPSGERSIILQVGEPSGEVDCERIPVNLPDGSGQVGVGLLLVWTW